MLVAVVGGIEAGFSNRQLLITRRSRALKPQFASAGTFAFVAVDASEEPLSLAVPESFEAPFDALLGAPELLGCPELLGG